MPTSCYFSSIIHAEQVAIKYLPKKIKVNDKLHDYIK